MSKNLKIAIIQLILAIILFVGIIGILITEMKNIDYMKQLEQINAEQIQECEVYRNRCKEYEDMMIESGLVVDNCECR